MAIQLKFVVIEHTHRQAWNGPGIIGSVKLYPVSGGSDENKSFYESTPGGNIEFSTINEAAMKYLPVGAEVYVTLEVV